MTTINSDFIIQLITKIADSSMDKKTKEYVQALREGKIQPKFEECQVTKIFLDGLSKAVSSFKEASPFVGTIQFFYVLVAACETNSDFRSKLSEMYNQLEDYFLRDFYES